MSWASLHNHSYFSLLDGAAPPKKMAAKAARHGFPALALTDHGNVGGAVDFAKACKGVGVRPILGCEFYLCREDPALEGDDPERRRANGRPYAHLVVLAKNRRGWTQVMRAVSKSNTKQHFYYAPRLCLENFREYAADGDLVAISGHPGSDLANCIFHDPKAAYACDSVEALRADHLRPDAKAAILREAERYVSVFGRENFRPEVQDLDGDWPAGRAIAAHVRWVAARLGLEATATGDSHYVDEADAYDQRVLLCSQFRTTLAEVQRKVDLGEDVALGGFFRSSRFSIRTREQMRERHSDAELDATLRVAEMCEDYDITGPPRLPAFPCPDGMSPGSYLRRLCEDGFGRLLADREATLDRPLAEYRDRLERELGVIEGAGLPSYFLIVQDLTNYGRGRGWLLGPGRGSGAGCLASYLTGITAIDPLPYGLLFERFYNAGRNAPGRVSLPDIDMDFPVIKRDEVFRYMQGKYGVDRVARIATFQSLQGRSAIDEVLAARGVDYEARKAITRYVPDGARVSEELQAMKEAGEEPSILRLALEMNADELSEWVRTEDDGTLAGEYASHFDQAIRLEGTKKAISTHAAGVVISDTPLDGACPLRWDDKSAAYVAAMEYPALEAMGLVKLDLLGVAMLNKGEAVRDLALTGEIAHVG